jgi:hypothetical protein
MSDGREINGYFAPGNRIARGNPGNRRMAELRKALLECATPERVAAVEKTLYTAAVGGDIAAIRVWLEHMVGRPVQAVEVSTPEGQSLDVAMVAAVALEAIGDDQGARLRVAEAFARLGRSGDGVGPRPGTDPRSRPDDA